MLYSSLYYRQNSSHRNESEYAAYLYVYFIYFGQLLTIVFRRKIIRQRQIKHDRIEALVNIITNQRTLIEELAEANEMYRKMVKDD